MDKTLLAGYADSLRGDLNYPIDAPISIHRSCRENASKEIEHTKYKGKYKGYKWYYIKEV